MDAAAGVDDLLPWARLWYAATVLLGRTDGQFWTMTLAQLDMLLGEHAAANQPPDDDTSPAPARAPKLSPASDLAALAGLRIGG